jgi:RNA polymerase sigma-70 factor (sigma-E family)
VRGARARDDAFREFFVSESDRLRRVGILLTGDPERAADLAQEALARTYRRWGRLRYQDPGPYARRVLVNLVRTEHRRSLLSARLRRPRDDAAPGPAAAVEEWMRVSDALKELSPVRRATIVLRFYDDMAEGDIARTLDRPLGTVKSDIHRGLAKLRQVLETTEERA